MWNFKKRYSTDESIPFQITIKIKRLKFKQKTVRVHTEDIKDRRGKNVVAIRSDDEYFVLDSRGSYVSSIYRSVKV